MDFEVIEVAGRKINVKQVSYNAPGKYKFEVKYGMANYTCYLCPSASLNNLVVDTRGKNVTTDLIGCKIMIACHHVLRTELNRP